MALLCLDRREASNRTLTHPRVSFHHPSHARRQQKTDVPGLEKREENREEEEIKEEEKKKKKKKK